MLFVRKVTVMAGVVGVLCGTACAEVDGDGWENAQEVRTTDDGDGLSSTSQALDRLDVGAFGQLPHASLTLFSESTSWGDAQSTAMNPASGRGHFTITPSSQLSGRVSSVRLSCNASAAAVVLSDTAGHEVTATCTAGTTTDVNLHTTKAYPGGIFIADKVTKVQAAVHPNATGYLPLGQLIRSQWEQDLPAAIAAAVPGGLAGAFTTVGARKDVEISWLSYDRFKLVQEFKVKVLGNTYYGGFEILLVVHNDDAGPRITAQRTDAWVDGWCDRNVLEVFCTPLLQDDVASFGDNVYRAMRSGGAEGARRLATGLADLDEVDAVEAYVDPDAMSVGYVYVP